MKAKRRVAVYFKGITRHVLTLLFLFGLVPMAVMSCILLLAGFRLQESNVMAMQVLMADRVAVGLSDSLEKSQAEVTLLARTINPLESNAIVMKSQALDVLGFRADYDFVSIIGVDGYEKCRVSRYHTYRDSDLRDRLSEPGFKEAIAGGFHITGLSQSEFNSFPYLFMTVPVYDQNHSVIGALEVGVNVSKLWGQIAQFNLDGSYNAYIVDKDGQLLASRDMSSVLSQENLSHIEAVSAAQHGLMTGMTYQGLDGENVIGTAASISPTAWILVIEMPARIAFQPIYSLLGIFAFACLATIVLAAGLGIRFSWRSIVQPLRYLEKEAVKIARGGRGAEIVLDNHDETGRLARAFNSMLQEVEGYQQNLEKLVDERTSELNLSNAELSDANLELSRVNSVLGILNNELEEKNSLIMESIDYASRLQTALMPARDTAMAGGLRDFMVLFQPVHSVGGDFYWSRIHDGCLYLALVDCTGHGVPGAMMTMTVATLLDRLVSEYRTVKPSHILKELDYGLCRLLQYDGAATSAANRDGAETGLCIIDPVAKHLTFASTGIPLFYSADGRINEIRTRRLGWAAAFDKETGNIQDHTIAIEEGRVFYMLTDGILDQSGGPQGWAFGRKRFLRQLQACAGMPLADQRKIFLRTMREYMGNNDQRDDMTLLGFSF